MEGPLRLVPRHAGRFCGGMRALCMVALCVTLVRGAAWDAHVYGRGRLPRYDDELRPLEWGQLQVLHTTDIHGWYQGHTKSSPPEPNYSGDWGDWIAFTQHMRRLADERGVDLLLVDTGDLHDGNGLSDAGPGVQGHVSDQVFALADYDLLTIGNHELYNMSVAQDVYEHFVPHWGDRYLTSNVHITLPGTTQSRPIGHRYTRFTTKNQRLTIQAYGVLFDFQLGAPGITVQDPKAMVKEAWFQASLRASSDVDAFVIAGHMPVTGYDGWDAIHEAIRSVWPTTPILMLGGHTHVRDCRMLDSHAMALESGRYLETVGWMSVSNVSVPTFSRRYIDANPRNYAFHAGLVHAGHLSTPRGRFVRATMDAMARAWNLTDMYGIVPRDYYLDRAPYGDPSALLTLMSEHILPDVVRSSFPARANASSLIIMNSGSQRFDVFAGAFTKNDQYIVSPFRDAFLFVPDVPWYVARRLVHRLNELGAVHNEQPGAVHPAQGDADPIFHQYLRHAFYSYWLNRLSPTSTSSTQSPVPSGRPASARRLEELLEQVGTDGSMAEALPHLVGGSRGRSPSLGYVTADSCSGLGDDTVHTPIPYSDEQPDYIAAQPVPLPSGDYDHVDVIFADFIAQSILSLLNTYDARRHYTMADVSVWGNATTESLYSSFAQLHWRLDSMDSALHDMDRAATFDGYPPLAPFDTYAGDPYAPVTAPRLVFQ